MTYAIAIEGGDGAGKSTLCSYIADLCQKFELSYVVVGREAENASAAVGEISYLLSSVDDRGRTLLTPNADLHIRLAREYQRINLALSYAKDVLVFDRFVLSVFAAATINQVLDSLTQPLLIDLIMKVHLQSTVYCDCPFDVSWKRVLQRANAGIRPLSGKEAIGPDYNRNLVNIMETEFNKGIITGKKWRVDTSSSIEQSKKHLDEYLLPVLETIRSPKLG